MRFLPPTPPRDPERVRRAWQDYLERGRLDPAQVRPHVARAWRRSRRAGCDAHLMRADVLSSADTAALLERERRLVEVATPFLAALSKAAGHERHAAMLGDAQGRVLKIVGDPQTMADEGFPQPGALLSEATAGANGIGTALAERHYVELVGPEHYIEGFHAFACQGVPLLGAAAASGGVLSTSVRRVETSAKVRDILFCASEAMECELISARLAESLIDAGALERVLEGLRQDIVQSVAMARLRLELAARTLAAGADASSALDKARRLVRTFRGQAAVWRRLVGEPAGTPEPLALLDLVADFVGLMQTEARVNRVALVWRRADKLRVLADPGALAQRLLGAVLSAMQAAEKGSEIAIDAYAEGPRAIVALHIRSPDGAERFFPVDAPRLK